MTRLDVPPGASERPPGGRVQSVDRAASLLRAVAASPNPASVPELAQACAINRSTAWRLLATLEVNGLVDRDPMTQRYRVGYASVQLGAASDGDVIARRVRPVLTGLSASLGETTLLCRASRFSLVYVDQASPPGPPTANWVGRSAAPHATSAGKAFLAWLPPDEIDAVLPAVLERYTGATITDRDELEHDLDLVRQRGYATCISEFEEFANGVGAAVLDGRGVPRLVVSVWGPDQRVTTERIDELGARVIDAAAAMSLALQ
jgi:DNA-binding IclR family transcriptional regulator